VTIDHCPAGTRIPFTLTTRILSNLIVLHFRNKIEINLQLDRTITALEENVFNNSNIKLINFK